MIDIEHNPQTILEMYLGPEVPIGITRTCLPYSCGLAPSYVPTYLLQEDLVTSKSVGLVEDLTEKKRVTPMLLRHLSADLQNHLETRIQLFLYQMLLVYKTGLSFAFYKQAELQIGAVPSKPSDESTYVGAHSGTIPTLRLAKEGFSNTSVSVAQNTSFYYGWNTTVYLPEIANQLDSSVDRTGHIPLRHAAIDILNDVSAGDLNPKEGLWHFLVNLMAVINIIKREIDSEEKLIILNNYSHVVDNYYENLEIGYPFIQRLCLRPLKEELDERFFMGVQAEMHTQLGSELQALEPQAAIMPQMPANIDLSLLQAEVSAKLPSLISTSAKEYITLCAVSDTVRAAAMRYFSSLHSLTPAERSADLGRILNIKKPATIEQVGLSDAAHQLYEAALEVTRAQKKEPNSMPLILLSVLCSVSRDIISRAPGHVPNSEAAKQNLQNLILMQLEGMKSGRTTDGYIALCSTSAKVQESARAVFNEWLQLAPNLQKTELENLLLMTKSKPFGLSPKAVTLVGDVLEALASNTISPRNLPTILLQVLLNANR